MEVVNVVSTASLNCDLDLKSVVHSLVNAIYNPKSFSGLIWRHPKIAGSVLLFRNGKLVHVGSRSIDESRKSIRRYARLLQKLHHSCGITNFKIQTITGVVNVGRTIDLIKLAIFIPEASFEPELFPTVMFRSGGLHFSITKRGKIIITGGKTIKAMESEADNILLLIELSD
jgi:transcription initiation factor TFIID TATA-box-binding protein